jgi:hypothetical protein
MTFPLTCLACGHVDHVEWSQIGRKATCGGCRKTSIVPAPMETLGEPVVRALCLKFACPSCGRKFATKPELAGKKIRCNRCGKGVRVPEGEAIFVSKSSRSEMSSFETDTSTTPPRSDRDVPAWADARARADELRARADELRARADEVEISARADELRSTSEEQAVAPSPSDVDFAKLREAKRRRRTETVLPSRAELMEQVRQQVEEEEVVETKRKTEKTKKKKPRKQGSGYFDPKETLKLVAGVGVVVSVLALLAWGYPEFRFPLGGLLCVIGFITYLLGSVSIRQVVAEEGILKALVFRFCPPYQWWFVATHWEETKDFVAFFVAGLLIMTIGSGIIKTSSTGKRAEESDRAYQKAVRGRQTTVPSVSLKGLVGGDNEGTTIERQR